LADAPGGELPWRKKQRMQGKKSRVGVLILISVLGICLALAVLQFRNVRAYPNLLTASQRVTLLQVGANLPPRVAWLSDHELLVVSIASETPWHRHFAIYDTTTRRLSDLNELNSALRNAPASYQEWPAGFTQSPDKKWLVWCAAQTPISDHSTLIAAKLDGTVIKALRPPKQFVSESLNWYGVTWVAPHTFVADIDSGVQSKAISTAKRCSVDVDFGNVELEKSWRANRRSEATVRISASSNPSDKVRIAADWPIHPIWDASMGLQRDLSNGATTFSYPALNSPDTKLIYASGCPEVQSIVITTREENSGELNRLSSRIGTALSPKQDAYVRVTALDLKRGVVVPIGQLPDNGGANRGASGVLTQLGLVVASPGCKNVYFVYYNTLYVAPVRR
jgi:hypothetical protein